MKILARTGLALLLSLPLAASSVIPVNFDFLSRGAHHVIGGRITEITAAKDPANGYIYSTVTLEVSQAVPQQFAGRQYTFRMIGGEMDGRTQYIADFPRFQVNDRVILFLNDQTSSVFGPTVGLWQGVFFVEEDPAGGREVVTDHLRRPIIGVRDQQLMRGFKRTTGDPSRALAGEGSTLGLRMNQFFEQVRTYRGLPSAEGPGLR